MKYWLPVAVLWVASVVAEPAPGAESAPSWKMLPDSSSLQFVFLQAGSDETGEFQEFEPVFHFDPKQLENSRFDVTVKMSSVDTGDGERDEILLSGDMFGVSEWPTARFKTKSISHKEGNRYYAEAELTIRDRTRDIPFPFTLEVNDAGRPVFHLQAEVRLNRLDFGVGRGDWADTTWIKDPVTVKVDVKARRDE